MGDLEKKDMHQGLYMGLWSIIKAEKHPHIIV